MTNTATALVQTGPRELEFQEIPLPKLEAGAAIVRIEANGICASDIDSYEGHGGGMDPSFSKQYPRINGHEIVGVIEELGPSTPTRQNLRVGDRVAINPWLSCGSCPACRRADPQFCTGMGWSPSCYGFIPTWKGPGLWGGYSTHAYVHPNTILYPFASDISPLDAALWNPLANGIQWTVRDGGATVGSKVAVLGSGQRGLSCVAAAKSAGASLVVATGLTRDKHKLEMALRLGAEAAFDVETSDFVSEAAALSGDGFDIVVDTSPKAGQPVLDAIKILRPGGTLVCAGHKGAPLDGFPYDSIALKRLRLVGVLGASHEALQMAAGVVSSRTLPISELRTHVFGFDNLPKALDVLQGKVEGENAINVVVTPTFTTA